MRVDPYLRLKSLQASLQALKDYYLESNIHSISMLRRSLISSTSDVLITMMLAPCLPDMIYELETQLSKERGLPLIDRKVFDGMISKALTQQSVLIFNPALARYAFAFPFGNYTCLPAMRVVGKDLELMFPIRSYTPEMQGYIATVGDQKGIGKRSPPLA